MTQSTTDMMYLRRAALDAMADLPGPPPPGRPLADIRIDLAAHLSGSGESEAPASLVAAVAGRLLRDDGAGGAGAVIVRGLSRYFDVPEARLFHENLFRRVWDQVSQRCGREGPGDLFKIKVNVTADGAIPLELYGSAWSFKQLHMDRDALIFSHLYGPVAGFTGGSLVLADVRTYMRRHRLRFDDLFEWSEEATPGSKPVLRAEHEADVLGECGVEIADIGPDEVIFVNNLPSAGILHGITPVVVAEPESFERVFHRCSVKGIERC